MVISGKFNLIGVEERKNQKGESYALVALAQGADFVKLMCKDMSVVKLPLYKEYNVRLSYHTKYERLSIEYIGL